ncbi:uncharacterized protein PHA67_009276 [Liasis olivaceus]
MEGTASGQRSPARATRSRGGNVWQPSSPKESRESSGQSPIAKGHKKDSSPSPPPRKLNPRLPAREAVKLFPLTGARTPPKYNSQQVLSVHRHYQLFGGYWNIFPFGLPFFDRHAQSPPAVTLPPEASLSSLLTSPSPLISLLTASHTSDRAERLLPTRVVNANQSKVYLHPALASAKLAGRSPTPPPVESYPAFLKSLL